MKKHFVCLLILCCLFLCACSGPCELATVEPGDFSREFYLDPEMGVENCIAKVSGLKGNERLVFRVYAGRDGELEKLHESELKRDYPKTTWFLISARRDLLSLSEMDAEGHEMNTRQFDFDPLILADLEPLETGHFSDGPLEGETVFYSMGSMKDPETLELGEGEQGVFLTLEALEP